jgi:hypothetical protein
MTTDSTSSWRAKALVLRSELGILDHGVDWSSEFLCGAKLLDSVVSAARVQDVWL